MPLRLLEPIYAKALSKGVGYLILIYTRDWTTRNTQLTNIYRYGYATEPSDHQLTITYYWSNYCWFDYMVWLSDDNLLSAMDGEGMSMAVDKGKGGWIIKLICPFRSIFLSDRTMSYLHCSFLWLSWNSLPILLPSLLPSRRGWPALAGMTWSIALQTKGFEPPQVTSTRRSRSVNAIMAEAMPRSLNRGQVPTRSYGQFGDSHRNEQCK